MVKLIRDKDQGEFRVGRADFGSKMGGSSLDVRAFLLILDMLRCCDFIESHERIFFLNLSILPCPNHPGGCTKICCWHHHWQERRDDQEDPE